MKQVVCGGEPVPYLFVRNGRLTWRQTIDKRSYLRAVPLPPIGRDGAVSREMVKEALKWIRNAQSHALAGRRDVLDLSMAHRGAPTVGEICELFRELCGRWGRPEPVTVTGYTSSLAKVAAIITGRERGEGVLISELTGERVGRVVDHYLQTSASERSARTTAHSTMNQARRVFSRRFCSSPEYLKLNVPPSILGFLKAFVCEKPDARFVPFSQAEVNVLRAGVELREVDPGAYAHWFAGYYLGLRLSEICQIRREWIREHQITDQERAGWMGGRKKVWVLDLALDPEAKLKTAASAGYVPLHDDVAAELLRIMGSRGWYVPGQSRAERYNAGHRRLNAWLREKGWTREKAHHSLRAFRLQVWHGKYGEECRAAWGRHSVPGMSKHYVSRLYLAKAPLSLSE